MNTNKKALARQAAIRDMLQKQEVVTLDQFCESLHASVATIRNDLTTLEKEGCLRRVRGGAVSTEGTPRNTVYASRIHLNERAKREVAARAIERIQPGMTIILDAGTTCAKLAQMILEKGIVCTVYTPSLTAIQILSRSPSVELIGAGGRLDRDHNRFEGMFDKEIAADIYFLVPDGLCDGMATGADREESARKQMYMRCARTTICLADDSKAGRKAPCEIGKPDEIIISENAKFD